MAYDELDGEQVKYSVSAGNVTVGFDSGSVSARNLGGGKVSLSSGGSNVIIGSDGRVHDCAAIDAMLEAGMSIKVGGIPLSAGTCKEDKSLGR